MPGSENNQQNHAAHIQDAMEAASLVLNDDMDSAEARLRLHREESAFHQLALGATLFVRSILTFDKSQIEEATAVLLACEMRALDDMKQAKRLMRKGWLRKTLLRRDGGKSLETRVYAPGTEFALVHAEAQLMRIILTIVVNPKNLKDAVKGLYKLHKTLKVLDRIIGTEERMMKRRPNIQGGDPAEPSSDDFELVDEVDEDWDEAQGTTKSTGTDPADGDDDDDWTAIDDDETAIPTDELVHKIISELEHTTKPSLETKQPASLLRLDLGPDPTVFTDPVDIFIHSGANMFYGMILLLRSMVPQQFSHLISLLGFRDERDRGIRMLWQSSKFIESSVNGAIGGLIFVSYYNEIGIWADILPSEEDIKELAEPGEAVGFLREQCHGLLSRLEGRYPKSRLVQLENGRFLANNKQLSKSIAILATESKTPQITSLCKFSQSLDAMSALNWTLMGQAHIKCAQISMGHPLHYYMAGCAEVELYRDAFHLSRALTEQQSRHREKVAADMAVNKHKRLAEAHFRRALSSGMSFMGKENIRRWQTRAESCRISLADAVGVSPAQEMIYLWYGTKKMDPATLERSLRCLSWDRCTASSEKLQSAKSDPFECAVKAVCEATLLRCLGQLEAARKVLTEGVLNCDA